MFKCKQCGRVSANAQGQCPACGEKNSRMTLSPSRVFKDIAGAEFYMYALIGLLGIALVITVGAIVYRLF